MNGTLTARDVLDDPNLSWQLSKPKQPNSASTAHDLVDDPILSTQAFPSPAPSPGVATAIVGDARRQDEFARLFVEVTSSSKLKHNWDFEGGLSADSRAVSFVTLLLRRLQQYTEIPVPIVRPISTGVFVSWHIGGREVYFEVDSDSVLVAERLRGKTVYSAEDPHFNPQFAARLVLQFFELAEGY